MFNFIRGNKNRMTMQDIKIFESIKINKENARYEHINTVMTGNAILAPRSH